MNFFFTSRGHEHIFNEICVGCKFFVYISSYPLTWIRTLTVSREHMF